MKNILVKSYRIILYLFYIFYLLLILYDANNKQVLYGIGLIIGSIFLAIIPFFINHCKKVNVRKWYLFTNVLISIFILLEGIDVLLVDKIANSETLMNVRRYVLAFSIALYVTSFIFMLFYILKDFFKKDYPVQKFDFHAIQMAVLSFSIILINYFTFDLYKPDIILSTKYNGKVKLASTYQYRFTNFNNILIADLIIGLVTIIILVGIEYYIYKKFDETKISENTRKFN